MFDIAVLGAGPAGLAACRAAAGKRVVLIDDNPSHGGQIWRGELAISIPDHVTFHPSTRVFDLRPGFTLHTDTQGVISAAKLIVCSGARELFLPFPGWTLPGVFGAGGLQAFVKSGLDVRGKRVAVAGSGPLLLAVGATLRKRGAKVSVIEQAPLGRLLKLLRAYPSKLPQAITMRLGLPMRTGTWPVRFDGKLHLSNGSALEVDYVACGFGLVPNTEAAQLLGCRLDDGFVAVDSKQQTSVAGVYCAGEPTGIGGLEKALAEGEVAGRAACGLATRPVSRRFVRDLIETYRLHPDLAALAKADTVVCRCENVTRGALDPFRSWRDAKLQTRCGMGACQGRICGPITQQLYGWTPESVRPPIVPVPAALFDQ
ncbi:MAG: FAD/NAD(P)-binding oxidoreductase [Acidobacteria bacterium]|nr:FAD/NAD(P)-binding oxidoreductase [Acidobacteriota bacterium]